MNVKINDKEQSLSKLHSLLFLVGKRKGSTMQSWSISISYFLCSSLLSLFERILGESQARYFTNQEEDTQLATLFVLNAATLQARLVSCFSWDQGVATPPQSQVGGQDNHLSSDPAWPERILRGECCEGVYSITWFHCAGGAMLLTTSLYTEKLAGNSEHCTAHTRMRSTTHSASVQGLIAKSREQTVRHLLEKYHDWR